jgi:hypothetical protein
LLCKSARLECESSCIWPRFSTLSNDSSSLHGELKSGIVGNDGSENGDCELFSSFNLDSTFDLHCLYSTFIRKKERVWFFKIRINHRHKIHGNHERNRLQKLTHESYPGRV